MKMSKLVIIILILIGLGLGAYFINILHGESKKEFALEPLEQRAQQDASYFPVIAKDLPQGFVALDTAMEKLEGVLRTLFWETNFVIQDSEGITIFQTDVKNSDFIVIHSNAYYINAEKFSEIAEYATGIFDQRNKLYDVGDTIEMRGTGGKNADTLCGCGKFELVITDVERIISKGTVVYEIKFSIDPSVDEAVISGFFKFVLTNFEKKHDDFVLIDRETIKIELGRFERINILVLNIPREICVAYEQDSMRKINIRDFTKRDT